MSIRTTAEEAILKIRETRASLLFLEGDSEDNTIVNALDDAITALYDAESALTKLF